MEKFVEECGESEQVLKDWHSGFASAVELEFLEESAELEYEREYLLNSQPLRIDLLVIKKNTEADIQNCIGRIFKKYNVVEYKSPGDGLNIDVFLKVLAYAFLYKADGKTVDERKVDEITVSLIREGKPNALFKKLKELGFTITRKFAGVYWISGPVLLSVQIIVMKELEEREHIWLKSLSKKLGKEGLKRLIRKAEGLEGVHSRSLADDVLQLAVNANKDVVEILKGEDSMCRALMEIMKPEIEAEVEARVKEKMAKIEEERSKAEKERVKAEKERVKAEKERIQIEQERVQMILDMAKESFPLTMIAKLVRKPLDEVQKILQSQESSI